LGSLHQEQLEELHRGISLLKSAAELKDLATVSLNTTSRRNGILGGDDGVTLPAGDKEYLNGNDGAYQQSEALHRCVDGGI